MKAIAYHVVTFLMSTILDQSNPKNHCERAFSVRSCFLHNIFIRAQCCYFALSINITVLVYMCMRELRERKSVGER